MFLCKSLAFIANKGFEALNAIQDFGAYFIHNHYNAISTMHAGMLTGSHNLENFSSYFLSYEKVFLNLLYLCSYSLYQKLKTSCLN